MGYYIANKGVQQGPFEVNELPAHGLRDDSLVWAEGMPDWQRADAVPEVAAVLQTRQADATPAPVAVPVPEATPSPYQFQQGLSYQSFPAAQQSNGMVVASLVLGIVSIFGTMAYCFPGIISAVLAIVFGFVGRGRVKRGETVVGDGMALAGIILGFIQVGLTVLAFVIFFIIGLSAAMKGHRF